MTMSVSWPGGERDDPHGEHDWDGDEPFAEESARNEAGAFDSRFEETGELALGDDDVRLPWLEGDDDDYEEIRHSSGQVLALVVLGLIAVGLIAGGIWWATRPRPDAGLVADGETIKAPPGPYKTRPDNPGGEVVAGTGDTSYRVAEGESRQVRMDDGDAPVAKPSAVASATPSASATAAAADAVGGVGVQVGAYSSREAADKGWTKLSQDYTALSGLHYRIVEGAADIGTVYRLQAMAPNVPAANHLCDTLKAAGLSCQVKR